MYILYIYIFIYLYIYVVVYIYLYIFIYFIYIYSYDGAEISELVGIYILLRLSATIDKNDSSLYRDLVFLVLRNGNGQKLDRVRKNNFEIFVDVCFLMDIETNPKSLIFLITRSI